MKEKSLFFKLEPTFRCNLECSMCPRFSSQDPRLDMAMETYERIHEAMYWAHSVDFTGWGESMLHKSINSMIEMAVAKGCRTYMTTNGTVLTERNSLALLEAGMNHLAVSIDGLTPETFDSLRAGASFTKVSENVRKLSNLISRTSSPMELAIAFTIQEANAAELDLLIPWMDSVGARVLHLKQLNVISNQDDWQRSFLKYRLRPIAEGERNLEELEARIVKVLENGRQEGVQVHMHSELPLSQAMTPRHCIAAPLESAYFSYEGKVAACCHLGHHVSRYMDGSFYSPSALFFGDIRQQAFPGIWNSPEFRAFRNGFSAHEYPAACRTCYLLYGK